MKSDVSEHHALCRHPRRSGAIAIGAFAATGLLASCDAAPSTEPSTEPPLPLLVWVRPDPRPSQWTWHQPIWLYAGTEQDFVAEVARDPNDAGVTWSLQCDTACGTLSATWTLSDEPVTYTAPDYAGQGGVGIIATSVTNPIEDGAMYVDIRSTSTLELSPAPYGAANVGDTLRFIATYGGDTLSTGVEWWLREHPLCEGDCGTLSPDGLFTAPPTVPEGHPVAFVFASYVPPDDGEQLQMTSAVTTPAELTVFVSPPGVGYYFGGCGRHCLTTWYEHLVGYVFNAQSDSRLVWTSEYLPGGTSPSLPTTTASGDSIQVGLNAAISGTGYIKATSLEDTTKFMLVEVWSGS